MKKAKKRVKNKIKKDKNIYEYNMNQPEDLSESSGDDYDRSERDRRERPNFDLLGKRRTSGLLRKKLSRKGTDDKEYERKKLLQYKLKRPMLKSLDPGETHVFLSKMEAVRIQCKSSFQISHEDVDVVSCLDLSVVNVLRSQGVNLDYNISIWNALFEISQQDLDSRQSQIVQEAEDLLMKMLVIFKLQ